MVRAWVVMMGQSKYHPHISTSWTNLREGGPTNRLEQGLELLLLLAQPVKDAHQEFLSLVGCLGTDTEQRLHDETLHFPVCACVHGYRVCVCVCVCGGDVVSDDVDSRQMINQGKR